jgi:pSer/pThr/pTyr-binding forkhead associated (FHA) protein
MMNLAAGARLGPCEIVAALGASGAMLEDLESRYGTYVGAVRLTGLVATRDGETGRFGNASVVFRSSATSASTALRTTGPWALVPDPD